VADLTLPGGLNPDELEALKRLKREAEEAGFVVVEVGMVGSKTPAALVIRRREMEPILRVLVAARSVLRNVEALELDPVVSGEEYETLQALRVTSAVLARDAVIKKMKTRRLGDVAHEEFARQALRGAEGED